MFCAKFSRNWPYGFGEDVENVNSFQIDRLMDSLTNDMRSEKLTWASSSGEQSKKQRPVNLQKYLVLDKT